MTVHHVWYPLYDQPVTLEMSREQLQIVQDVLRGNLGTSKQGWRDYLADQIEKVLVASIEGDPEPTEPDPDRMAPCSEECDWCGENMPTPKPTERES